MVRTVVKAPLTLANSSRIVSNSVVCDPIVIYPEYMLRAYPHVYRGRKLYVFNHINFKDELNKAARKGVQKEADLLVKCFGRLKFHVYVYEDYSRSQIFEVLENVSKMDPEKLECVAFVFSTYGVDNQLYCYDTKYNEMDMLKMFKGKLPGIPKLFFIQCGRENSKDIELPDDDMLVMYSSKAGQCSYRNTDDGGWFINALTMQLNNLGRNSNLLSELQNVVGLVEREFAKKHGREQTPILKCKLTKDLYIGPEVYIKP